MKDNASQKMMTSRMVKQYATNYDNSNKNKVIRHKRRTSGDEMQSMSFESILVDAVDQLEITENNNRYILIIQCNLAKFIQVECFWKTSTARRKVKWRKTRSFVDLTQKVMAY